MTAVVGIAKGGYSPGNYDMDEFVVVTDGTKTMFMFPEETTDDDIDVMLGAMGARIKAANTSNPEEIIDMLSYNMPITISMSEPLGSFEEAEEKAQNYMSLVNDMEEGPFEMYEPVFPEGLSEENEEGEEK